MSNEPTDRNPSIAKLCEEGFEIEIVHEHLLVHSIPYLDSHRNVRLGVLACPYNSMGDQDTRPDSHTMWLQGELPHMGDGKPMAQVVNNSKGKVLFAGFAAQHFLSNKNGEPGFPNNFYEKVTHYHNLLASQARTRDPNADGRTGVVHPQRDRNSVFKYPDTASSRAGITAVSQRLDVGRVAIVGLGGTGSYILDLLAKTPIGEIHLFDGDDFAPHNAFRAPGAATFAALSTRPKKVEYLREAYEPMRSGIVAHPYHLDSSNIDQLTGFDFVFVAVDHGPSRKLVAEHLVARDLPFVDVGIGVEQDSDGNGCVSLSATCRVTMATSQYHDHVSRCLDYSDERDEALYRKNIQVADLNALNATLAVIRWKQFMGFYSDQEQAHNLSLSLQLQSLARSELRQRSG